MSPKTSGGTRSEARTLTLRTAASGGYLLAIVQLNEPVVPIRERSSQYFGSLSELDVSIVG